MIDMRLITDETPELAIDRIVNLNVDTLTKYNPYYGGNVHDRGTPCVTLWIATFLATHNTNTSFKNFPFMWATILKKIGYGAIVDDYGSVIYNDEPIQALFLTTNGLNIVDSWSVNRDPDVGVTPYMDKMKKTNQEDKKYINSFLGKSKEDRAKLS